MSRTFFLVSDLALCYLGLDEWRHKKIAGSEREPQAGDVLSGSYVMTKAFGFDMVRRACRLEGGLCVLARRLHIHTPVFLYFFIFVNVFSYFLLTDGRLQLKLVLHLTCVYCTGLLTLQTRSSLLAR